jgi:glutamine amidotransferase
VKPILIVDYGMANLRSVQKAFEKVGFAAEISGDPNRVPECERLVLPGVGAFRDAIARLNETGLSEPIKEHVRKGKKFLGICLGMQLIFDVSYEDGEYRGLGILPGKVVRFADAPGLKVPHMGWNHLRVRQRHGPFRETADGDAVYFVHSYYPVPRDADLVAGEADYPTPFCAAVARGNVFATQFHPEKSQRVGLTMLPLWR